MVNNFSITDDAWAMIQRSAENVLVGLGHSDKVPTPVEI